MATKETEESEFDTSSVISERIDFSDESTSNFEEMLDLYEEIDFDYLETCER